MKLLPVLALCGIVYLLEVGSVPSERGRVLEKRGGGGNYNQNYLYQYYRYLSGEYERLLGMFHSCNRQLRNLRNNRPFPNFNWGDDNRDDKRDIETLEDVRTDLYSDAKRDNIGKKTLQDLEQVIDSLVNRGDKRDVEGNLEDVDFVSKHDDRDAIREHEENGSARKRGYAFNSNAYTLWYYINYYEYQLQLITSQWHQCQQELSRLIGVTTPSPTETPTSNAATSGAPTIEPRVSTTPGQTTFVPTTPQATTLAPTPAATTVPTTPQPTTVPTTPQATTLAPTPAVTTAEVTTVPTTPQPTTVPTTPRATTQPTSPAPTTIPTTPQATTAAPTSTTPTDSRSQTCDLCGEDFSTQGRK